MLQLTFVADGDTLADGLLLCNSSRSLSELQVEFNHARQITISQLAASLGSGQAGLAQDLGNQRNTLSLRVRRSVDFTETAFTEPEAALNFALNQPAQFLGTGTLIIQLTGSVSGTVYLPLYLLNVGISAIKSKYEDLGIAPAFDYTFNGGLITTVSPFS